MASAETCKLMALNFADTYRELLSLKEKLSYGASDCAYNLVFNVVTTYMMFYYTDVAGISLLSVGTLFLVVRVLDAVAGPVVGALIDKTHTKWGKVRPWFLWFGAPFAIIGVMAFSVPNFGGVIKMIYVYVTYIMMNFLAVTVTTPCTALLPNLTTNAQERVNANAFRNVGGQIGVFHEVIVHGVLVVPQLEVEEVDDVIGRVLSQREILRPTVPEEIPGDVDYVIPCVDRLPDVYVGELVGTQQHPAVLVGLGIAVVVIDVFVVHDRRRGRCPLSSLLVAFMGVGRGVAFCWCRLGRCCVGAGGAFSVLGR